MGARGLKTCWARSRRESPSTLWRGNTGSPWPSSRTRCVSPPVGLRRGHPEGLPTLFIDRSLGRVKVPTLLREAGLRVVTLAEHYGIPQDQDVEDVTWLADTAARGWAALGKDERIRRRPAEKAAVRGHGARCFY